MKIVIAPDSYKGSLTAREVAIQIEQGFLHVFPKANFVLAPMADGGEGTLDCFVVNEDIELHQTEVSDPLGKKILASYGIRKDNTAVIEIARASGLSLVPFDQRDPLKSSSFGTGELILSAFDKGCRRFIIGLGGSATCDGGIGALAALGIQFKNSKGATLEPNAVGLETLASIDTSNFDPRLQTSEFLIAHDVDNPLLGLNGALMYAPQKGATPVQIDRLHKALENYAEVIHTYTHKNVGNIKGTGSAGGMGAGFYAFLNAKLIPGAPFIMDCIHLRKKIQDANLVITGEGQIDSQTIYGKTPIAVAKLAKEFKIPVIAIAARLGRGYHEVYEHGIDAVFSIVNGPISHEICLAYTRPLLTAASNNIARLLNLRMKP